MKNLLSFQEKRIVNILYALTVDQDYMTLKDIQSMNECSDRTVLSDIKHIRDIWGDEIYLEHFENVLFIRNRSMGKLHQYIFDVLNQSLLCNLLISVFFHPEENMEYHAVEAYVSTSHALRTLSDVDFFLKKHGLTVSKVNGKHFIEGNSELNLRYFMTDFLMQYQTISDSFNNKNLMLSLLEILRQAFQFHKIPINELLLNHFNLSFYLSILREKQGFHILDSIEQFNDFDFELNENLEFTKEEIKAGLNQFNDFIFVYNKNKHLEETIRNNFDDFIEREKVKNVFREPEIISEPIYIFMISVYCNPNRLEKLLDRTKIYGEDTQKVRPQAFDSLLKQIDKFDMNMKNFILKHLNEIIFWIALELNDYEVLSSKKVLVVSDLGEQHALDLRHYIKLFFSHHDFSTGSTLHGLSKDLIENLDSFDLIISTTLLSYDNKVPMIEINDSISEKDIGRIFTALR